MIRRTVAVTLALAMALGIAGCGVKSPPKYVPDAPAAEQKKS